MLFSFILLLNYYILNILSLEDDLILVYERLDNTLASNQQPLLKGRGLTTFVSGNGNFNTLYVHYKYTRGGVEAWTKTAQLLPPSSRDPVQDQFIGAGQTFNSPITNLNYFFNVDLIQSHLAGNVVIAGAYLTDGLYPNTGAAYIYSGVWTKWSLQQTLTLDVQKENDMFGTSVAFNHVSMTEAAITCLGCDPTRSGFANSSATYIYTSQPPYHNRWSQQQILIPRDSKHEYIGYGLVFDRDLLLVTGSTRASRAADAVNPSADSFVSIGRQLNVYLYQRSLETKLWTEQQILAGSLTTALNLYYDVEDETVMISNGANGGWFRGYINIYYPNTLRYNPKPGPKSLTDDLSSHSDLHKHFILSDDGKSRPRTPQWSLQQVLTDPLGVVDGGFGAYFDAIGNSLVVTRPLPFAPQGRGLYIYERPSLSGKWSVQQIIDYTPSPSGEQFFWPVAWYGHTIGLGDITDSGYNMRFYSSATEWACLSIRLEDAFGDGWDNAALYAEAPDGTIESYKPYCDTDNPLEFRFCPLTADDDGLYKFYIDNAPKSKFHWEIQWQIFEERTGKWYRGDHKTKMDFYWEHATRDFTRRAIVHDLPLNITCHDNCKSRPTPKPTPSDYDIPKRILKGSTSPIPTISPAPTLSQTSNAIWQYLKLEGSSWFSTFHHGTNYYISDLDGRKLISTGTKCNQFTTQNCWQDLPDGDYVLRITGDLNLQPGTRRWTFCGRTGTSSEMLVFTIADGHCDAIEAYTRTTYCSKRLSTTALADVIFLISGTSSTLTTTDQNDMITSLVYAFPELTSNDIHIISVTPETDALVVEIQFVIPITAYGYDEEDLSSIKSTYETFISKLNNEVATGHIKEIMASTSGQSDLTQITSVNIYETKLKVRDVQPLSGIDPDSSPIDSIVTFEPPVHATEYHDENSNEISWKYILELCTIYSTSAVGYLIFGCILVISVYSVHTYIQNRRQNYPTIQTVNEINDKNNDINNNNDDNTNNTNNNNILGKLNEKRIQLEAGIVSFLDDIGDIVVDVIYPPEDEFQSS